MISLRNCLTRLAICAVVVFVLPACQTNRPQTIQKPMKFPDIVYPLAELNNNRESLDAMFQTIMKGQTAIIKIDKDYIFPLIFDLKNKASEIDLNNNSIELSFKQDMYLSISKKFTKLSRDGRNWHDIKNLEALKGLLAYKKGALTFSISANTGDSVAILMTIATDADGYQ
jgi:hypothetical protein